MQRSRRLRTTPPADLLTQAARIRHARLSSGYSQLELAQLISQITGKATGKPTVSKWESGKTTNPELDTFYSLSRVTGFSAHWLNTGFGEMKVKEAPSDELSMAALGAAIRTFYPATTESQVHGIRTVYQVLVKAALLDGNAMTDIEQALRSSKTAI